MKKFFLILFLFFVSSSAFAIPQKVVEVIFENTDYSGAIGQPFFAQLAKAGVLLTNFRAIGHPSQPNYVAMVGGATDGVSGDGQYNITANHLGDLLEAKSKTWKVYAELYPGNCYQGMTKGKYARKHVPFISFTNVQSNSARCANIVDGTTFARDFQNKQLANYSMYVPDLNHDGHDTGVAYADNWFSQTFGPLFQDTSSMQNVLFIITFDEDDGSTNNHVYTVLYGPDVVPGKSTAAAYNHYSVLRTIEEIFQLGTLGKNDATASPIAEAFR